MALNAKNLSDAIKGTKGDKLQKDIIDDLKTVKTEIKVPNDKGELISKTVFPFNPDEIKKENPDAPNPRSMELTSGNNEPNKYTGLEAIVEVIVERVIDAVSEEVLTHIKNNLEVSIPTGSFVNVVTGGSGSPAVGTLNIVPVVIKSPNIS